MWTDQGFAVTPSEFTEGGRIGHFERTQNQTFGFEDLKRIRGIGVLIEKKLNSMGVVAYEQIANWTAAEIDRVSQSLDFKGRIERENWVEQARILASGGATEFSRRVGAKGCRAAALDAPEASIHSRRPSPGGGGWARRPAG